MRAHRYNCLPIADLRERADFTDLKHMQDDEADADDHRCRETQQFRRGS